MDPTEGSSHEEIRVEFCQPQPDPTLLVGVPIRELWIRNDDDPVSVFQSRFTCVLKKKKKIVVRGGVRTKVFFLVLKAGELLSSIGFYSLPMSGSQAKNSDGP